MAIPRRRKKKIDTPETSETPVEGDAPVKDEGVEIEETVPVPPPPPVAPPPTPKPEAVKKPTGRWFVLLDGEPVGKAQPTRMHALRASVAYNTQGYVTVAEELA